MKAVDHLIAEGRPASKPPKPSSGVAVGSKTKGFDRLLKELRNTAEAKNAEAAARAAAPRSARAHVRASPIQAVQQDQHESSSGQAAATMASAHGTSPNALHSLKGAAAHADESSDPSAATEMMESVLALAAQPPPAATATTTETGPSATLTRSPPAVLEHAPTRASAMLPRVAAHPDGALSDAAAMPRDLRPQAADNEHWTHSVSTAVLATPDVRAVAPALSPDGSVRPQADSRLLDFRARPAESESRLSGVGAVPSPSSPGQEARAASLRNEARVTVIEQQTHFAPDARGMPVALPDAETASVPIPSGGNSAVASASDQQLRPRGPDREFSELVGQAGAPKVFAGGFADPGKSPPENAKDSLASQSSPARAAATITLVDTDREGRPAALDGTSRALPLNPVSRPEATAPAPAEPDLKARLTRAEIGTSRPLPQNLAVGREAVAARTAEGPGLKAPMVVAGSGTSRALPHVAHPEGTPGEEPQLRHEASQEAAERRESQAPLAMASQKKIVSEPIVERDSESQSNRAALPAGQLDRIATTIIDEAFADTPPRALGPAKPPLADASRAPVRNLTIQLHPVELGLVHVEMRAAAGTLSVKVRAAHADTAKLLEDSQDALSGLLRSAGHDLTALTVQVMHTHAASPTFAPAENMQAQHALGEGQASSHGERSTGDQAAGGEPGAERNAPRQGKQPDANSSGQNGRRRDLYV